jgi:hypothetical protein
VRILEPLDCRAAAASRSRSLTAGKMPNWMTAESLNVGPIEILCLEGESTMKNGRFSLDTKASS